MSYFIVKDGAIGESFETIDEANAAAAAHDGARVIGDEWITLSDAKLKVERAFAALDEVAPMVDADRLAELRVPLEEVDAMIDRALERLGLDPG
jgi:hypothetical protein